MNSDNLRGMGFMLLAVATLSVMDMALKLLAAHYPPLQVGALRGLASWPLIVVWIAAAGSFRSLLRVRWPLHLLRGVMAIGMMAAFVYALRDLPLTTAYTLFFISPLLITALSAPLLGERVGLHRWLAIVVGFCGVMIALRPAGVGLISLSSLAVLAAATAYALSAITVRVLARTDSTQAMMFWLITFLGFGSLALAAPNWVPLRSEHWALVVGAGLMGTIGQYAITRAFSIGEASAIAPLEYTALVWSLGFDFFSGSGLPDRSLWLGAGIIICSGLYLMQHERRRRTVIEIPP